MKPRISEVIRTIRSREQMDFDDSSLDDVMAWWQRALGLDAWSIGIRRERGFRMDGAGGRVNWMLSKHRAWITIIEHADVAPGWDPIDDEKVIVHELLHVLFAALDDKLRPKGPEISDVEEAICIEQPIDRLANLLVTLRRAPRGDMP